MCTKPREIRIGKPLARIRTGLFLVAGLAATGCSTPEPPSLSVADQWYRTIRNYSVYPIYPMQEDIQLGDVLLLQAPSQDQDPANATMPRLPMVKLGTPNAERVREFWLSYHAERFRIPGLRGEVPKPDTRGRLAPVTAAGEPIDLRGSGPVFALKQAALPDLAVARVTQGALSGGGFFGSVGASLGLGSSGTTAVSISLRNIEEMSLPASDALRALRDDVNTWLDQKLPTSALFAQLYQLDPGTVRAVCELDRSYLDRKSLRIMVVNEVLYARGISYEYSGESSTGIQLALDLTKVLAAVPGVGIPERGAPDPTPARGGNAPPAPAANATRQADALAGKLDDLLKSLAGSAQVGAQASIAVGRTGGLQLIEDFERPMAFGVGSYFAYEVLDVLAHHLGETGHLSAEIACNSYMGREWQGERQRKRFADALAGELAYRRTSLIQLCAVQPRNVGETEPAHCAVQRERYEAPAREQATSRLPNR